MFLYDGSPGYPDLNVLWDLAARAFDERGTSLIDEVGELVITEPMPSMPLYLWNDPDNSRYIASYFDMYPGVWRHGDWVKFTSRGSGVILGRSDSTINRLGVRMGSSEIYAAVEDLAEVTDSLVIGIETPQGGVSDAAFCGSQRRSRTG